MTEKLHIFVSLVAGIIFTVYALLKEFEFFFWIKNVISIIVIFYVLGLITRNYIQMVLSTPKQEADISVEEVDIEDDEEEVSENSDDNKTISENTRSRRKFDFNKDDE